MQTNFPNTRTCKTCVIGTANYYLSASQLTIWEISKLGVTTLVACHTFPIETTKQEDNTRFSRSPYHFPSKQARALVLAMDEICVNLKLNCPFGWQDHIKTHANPRVGKTISRHMRPRIMPNVRRMEPLVPWVTLPSLYFQLLKSQVILWVLFFFLFFRRNKNEFNLIEFGQWNKALFHFSKWHKATMGTQIRPHGNSLGCTRWNRMIPRTIKAPRHDQLSQCVAA